MQHSNLIFEGGINKFLNHIKNLLPQLAIHFIIFEILWHAFQQKPALPWHLGKTENQRRRKEICQRKVSVQYSSDNRPNKDAKKVKLSDCQNLGLIPVSQENIRA